MMVLSQMADEKIPFGKLCYIDPACYPVRGTPFEFVTYDRWRSLCDNGRVVREAILGVGDVVAVLDGEPFVPLWNETYQECDVVIICLSGRRMAAMDRAWFEWDHVVREFLPESRRES